MKGVEKRSEHVVRQGVTTHVVVDKATKDDRVKRLRGSSATRRPSWRTDEGGITFTAMSATFRAVVALMLPFLAFSLVGCPKYNELVDEDQICQQRWADVEAQVQRRYDLVPNLVATVKGSAAHEEKTLETGKPFKPRVYFTASPGAETAPKVAL